MAIRNMTTDEKRWQAEGDAHTLARAQEVQGDKSRMSAARKVAATQAKELQKQTTAMQNVARKKTPAKPARKVSTAKKSSGARSKNSGKASRGGRRK